MFFLSFLRGAGSPLPDVALSFKIVFKETIWLEVVILLKYSMESIKGVTNDGFSKRSDVRLKFSTLFIQLDDVYSVVMCTY